MSHRPRALPPAVLALVLATSSAAVAGKWDGGCPEPRTRLYKTSNDGYTTSPFVHIGHDVTFQVRETAALRGEGFSVEPNGVTVEIIFTPIKGVPIPLPTFTVTAISPMTVRFPMPDPRVSLGRLVVGPAVFRLRNGDTPVMTALKWPVVLPPMNDVRALVDQGGEAQLLGTIGPTAKQMWIPVSFAGFGQGDPMPSCPTATLTPVTAFAVDLTLRRGDGQFMPHTGMKGLKNTLLWFGDYDLWGKNLYGTKFSKLPALRRLSNGGVALCALNDTFDVVMRIKLQGSAKGRRSEIIPVQQDGSPYTMTLRNITAEVAEEVDGLPRDSLGAICPVDL